MDILLCFFFFINIYICSCLIETGFSCSGNNNLLTCIPHPICGDSLLVSGEECDDGDSINGNGCSSQCRIEANSFCPSKKVAGPCYQSQCGDGYISLAETCDDGNAVSGDGCSNSCQPEIYYSCLLANTSCILPIFVDPTHGATSSDPSICGTSATPCQTISVGINAAKRTHSTYIRVKAGTYSLTTGIAIDSSTPKLSFVPNPLTSSVQINCGGVTNGIMATSTELSFQVSSEYISLSVIIYLK